MNAPARAVQLLPGSWHGYQAAAGTPEERERLKREAFEHYVGRTGRMPQQIVQQCGMWLFFPDWKEAQPWTPV